MSRHRTNPTSNRPSIRQSHRRRHAGRGLAFIALTIAALTAGTHAQPTSPVAGQEAHANFDIRVDKTSASDGQLAYLERRAAAAASTAGLARAREAGVARLKAADDAVAVTLHPSLGVTQTVSAMPGGGFLTPPSTDRVRALRSFLSAYGDAYGVSAQQVQALDVVADYVNPAGNMAWVELEQSFNGIPVFQGMVRGGFTAKGELARTTGTLATGIDEATLATTPAIGARQAIALAAGGVDWTVNEGALVDKGEDAAGHMAFGTPDLADDAKAWLVYFAMRPGVARLAWATVLIGDPMGYLVLLDAEDGTMLFLKNLTNFQTQPATYVVYNDDSPAPLSPTTVLPGTGTQAPAIARSSITVIGNEAPNTFNTNGWINDGDNVTTGTNVEAGVDLVGPDGVDAPVTGSALRVFDFAYNPAPGAPPPGDAPTTATYRNGEVTDMFYWTNIFHDRTYLLGFTEAARNFQQENFGRGGVASDRVRAEAQDSSGTNNANFLTPPDGTKGRMQMFVFPGPTPDRTSGLDHDVLLHELAHGLSNRLHINGGGLTTLEARGLGEGWSDFYARALLATAGEDVNGIYSTGGWVTFNFPAGAFTDNYYYGIRRFPYAVKTNLGTNGKPHNPLTFADIDPTKINTTDGAFPNSPIIPNTATEVHNTGEVWCMALLEGRARFITRLGFVVGNQRFLQFVTDGMKLDPPDPTFLQARDSVIAAANAGGGTAADIADIWAGFATRGMGVLAASTGFTVTESFLTPADTPPTFSINDVSVVEGDSGTTTAAFTVSLANPSSSESRVSFSTGNNTAASQRFPFTSGPIGIPLGWPPTSIGPATPYPATVNVAGVTGSVASVAVKLNGFSHSFPDDVDVLLVGPAGQKVMVMSDIGGLTAVANIDLTFQDGAPAPPATLVTGTFAPTDEELLDTMPVGAPAGPYGVLLSAFNGTDPNGTWSLFVADDAAVDVGTIDSFTLLITTTTGGDYTASTGQLIFPPGTTTQPVNIIVNGDPTNESNETFVVNLASPINAVIGDAQGVGTILADEGPQPPIGLFASSIVGNNLTLRFTPPSAGPAPTGFMLAGGLNPGETIATVPTGSTAPVFTIAVPNGAFYLRMHTITGAGTSGPSNEIRVFINTPTPPSAPTNLLAMVNGSNLSLAWKNTFTGGAPTSMILDATGSLTGSVPLPLGDNVSFGGVPPGTYTISMRAANAAGASGSSNTVTVTIPSACTGAPLTPINFLTFKVGSTLSLFWDPAATGAAPTGFQLNVTGAFTGGIPLPGRSIGGSVPPGTYNFTVQATNPCGASAPTGVQSITVP